MSFFRALLWVGALVYAFTVAGWVGAVALLMVGGMFAGKRRRPRRTRR